MKAIGKTYDGGQFEASEHCLTEIRTTEIGSADFDLAEVGTIEEGAVTFRVSLQRVGGSASAEETILLERTVTTPDRWEPASVELADFAGEDVMLSLTLAAAEPGAIGFWGSPAVRNRGQAPPGVLADRTEEPPHGVILIMADTLRSDHLDAYGYERATAPTLRRLAAEGALFRDAIAQATWTKVSTPSILTSLYPASHTVKDVPDRLPSSAVTLAEVYRDAGYATLSLSSVTFTGRSTNLHQGFEELHESGSRTGETRGKSAREYVDRVLPWLETHRDVPFFVFLHVFDPHSPFEPREPYDRIWADPAKKEVHESQLERLRQFIASPSLRRRGMPSRDELE